MPSTASSTALGRSARALSASLKADGAADKAKVFAEGWLDNDTSFYRGRPVDVAAMKDGSLLVADYAGALCCISDGAP